MQIRVGLSQVQHVFPSPFEATGVSGAPIDFDVLRGDELCKSVHIPSVRNLFNVTTNDELILVCRHTSMLHAERDRSELPPPRASDARSEEVLVIKT
jgi:hypothetical protein